MADEEKLNAQLRERPMIATFWLVMCVMAALVFVQESHETGTLESTLLAPVVAMLAGVVFYLLTYEGYKVVRDELRR